MKTCSFVASGRVAACAALLMAGVSVAFAQTADERTWVNLLPGGAYSWDMGRGPLCSIGRPFL